MQNFRKTLVIGVMGSVIGAFALVGPAADAATKKKTTAAKVKTVKKKKATTRTPTTKARWIPPES